MATEKQQEKKEETRRRILDAGTRMFSEKGFAGARMDEIAKRAGLNKATIYYHVGDKEALYAEVIHDIFGDIADHMAAAIAEADTPKKKFCAYIDRFAEGIDRHPHLPPIMMRELASGGGSFPLRVAQDLRKVISMLTAILEEGSRSGCFIETIPFSIHSMVVGGLVFFRASHAIRSRFGGLDPQIAALPRDCSGSIADEFKKHILQAIEA